MTRWRPTPPAGFRSRTEGEAEMSSTDRWVLALLLVAVDLVIFAIPLTGLFAAYLLLLRPAWFRTWVEDLYSN